VNQQRDVSRRRFIGKTLAATAAAGMWLAKLQAAEPVRPPESAPANRITIGMIGTGDHGVGMNLRGAMRETWAL